MTLQDRMNEDELEFDEDQAFHNGRPFTGSAFLVYPNGQLKKEVMYKDGFEEGPCREWFASGQLKREWNAVHGRAEGKVTEWHENGKIKSILEAEHGVRLSHAEWKENGELLRNWQLDVNSAQYKSLQQMREAEPS